MSRPFKALSTQDKWPPAAVAEKRPPPPLKAEIKRLSRPLQEGEESQVASGKSGNHRLGPLLQISPRGVEEIGKVNTNRRNRWPGLWGQAARGAGMEVETPQHTTSAVSLISRPLPPRPRLSLRVPPPPPPSVVPCAGRREQRPPFTPTLPCPCHPTCAVLWDIPFVPSFLLLIYFLSGSGCAYHGRGDR